MALLGAKGVLKMIVSHRTPSSLNMSSYGAIWTHFRPNSMIFSKKKFWSWTVPWSKTRSRPWSRNWSWSRTWSRWAGVGGKKTVEKKTKEDTTKLQQSAGVFYDLRAGEWFNQEPRKSL